MTGLVIGVHIIVCVGLIIVVLVQRGRGGGLVESFSGLESMFGTKTNAFLTKITTVFAVIYFFTCLGLTFLSIRQSKSLLKDIKTRPPAAAVVPLTATKQAAPEVPKTDTTAQTNATKAAANEPAAQAAKQPAK